MSLKFLLKKFKKLLDFHIEKLYNFHIKFLGGFFMKLGTTFLINDSLRIYFSVHRESDYYFVRFDHLDDRFTFFNFLMLSDARSFFKLCLSVLCADQSFDFLDHFARRFPSYVGFLTVESIPS